MTALPLARSHRAAPSLESRVDEHVAHYVATWASTPEEIASPPLRIGMMRRASNARHTRRLIDEIARRVETRPTNPATREVWQSALRERIRRFGEQRLHWPSGYRKLIVADEFWQSSRSFVQRARAFAPDISSEDLFQALRNVWIINSVQMLLDLEVECRPPAFAYSMLYPWTDNLLDSPEVDRAAKLAFNQRLGCRLRGEIVEPHGRHEAEVFDLVAMIEDELPRSRCPGVYSGLLAIHSAQEGSLEQQVPGRTDEELLAVSFRKGGCSVLPDGLLVDPDLGQAETRFLFGYGVFLQLLDDLQDVEADLDAGHETIFTRQTRLGTLDAPTGRLWSFIDRCLLEHPRFSQTIYADRIDLVRRNCRALLVGAVAEFQDRFSRSFRRSLGRKWPLSLGATRRVRSHAERRFRRTGRLLRDQRGAEGWMELLDEEIADDPLSGGTAARRAANPSINRE